MLAARKGTDNIKELPQPLLLKGLVTPWSASRETSALGQDSC
jgi:hypothetical protein